MTKKNRKKHRGQAIEKMTEKNIEPWHEYWPDVQQATPIIQQSYSFLVSNWEQKKKVDLSPIDSKLSYIFAYFYDLNTQFIANPTKEKYIEISEKYETVLDFYKDKNKKFVVLACVWLGQMANVAKLPKMQAYWLDYLLENGRQATWSFDDLCTIIYQPPHKRINSKLFSKCFGIYSKLTPFAQNFYESLLPLIRKEIAAEYSANKENFIFLYTKPGKGNPSIYTNHVDMDYNRWKKLTTPVPHTFVIDGKKRDSLVRRVENKWRTANGLPQIGAGWVNEQLLFLTIQKTFSNYKVLQHARPSFLGRQHYDIYLPDFKIALEYQGEQHFRAVSIFGGEEKLRDTQQRDIKKKRISEINDVHLIYVLPNYDIDEVVSGIAQKAGVAIPKIVKVSSSDLKSIREMRKFVDNKQ